jgi:hypothetical protein
MISFCRQGTRVPPRRKAHSVAIGSPEPAARGQNVHQGETSPAQDSAMKNATSSSNSDAVGTAELEGWEQAPQGYEILPARVGSRARDHAEVYKKAIKPSCFSLSA